VTVFGLILTEMPVGFTVTPAEQVLLPAVFVTVIVYVVLTVGETLTVPPEGLTEPTPLSTEALTGLPEVVHESVDEPPLVIVEGDAERVQVGEMTAAGVVKVLSPEMASFPLRSTERAR